MGSLLFSATHMSLVPSYQVSKCAPVLLLLHFPVLQCRDHPMCPWSKGFPIYGELSPQLSVSLVESLLTTTILISSSFEENLLNDFERAVKILAIFYSTSKIYGRIGCCGASASRYRKWIATTFLSCRCTSPLSAVNKHQARK